MCSGVFWWQQLQYWNICPLKQGIVIYHELVVEPTHLKNISQSGSFPQDFGVKIKNVWNYHLDHLRLCSENWVKHWFWGTQVFVLSSPVAVTVQTIFWGHTSAKQKKRAHSKSIVFTRLAPPLPGLKIEDFNVIPKLNLRKVWYITVNIYMYIYIYDFFFSLTWDHGSQCRCRFHLNVRKCNYKSVSR